MEFGNFPFSSYLVLTVTSFVLATAVNVIAFFESNNKLGTVVVTLVVCAITAYVTLAKYDGEHLKDFDYYKVVIGALFSSIFSLSVFVVRKMKEQENHIKLLNSAAALISSFPEEELRTIMSAEQHINTIKNTKHKEQLLSPIAHSFSFAVEGVAHKKSIEFGEQVFKKFWESCVRSVDRYVSVCDLEPYVNLSDTQLADAMKRLKFRTEDEVAKLLKAAVDKRKNKTFDKILLYKAHQKDEQGNLPCCSGKTPKCTPASCNADRQCIVKELAADWMRSADKISKCYSGNFGQCNIWIMSHDKFADIITDLRAKSDIGFDVLATDIGLFGDDLVGEEHVIRTSAGVVIYTYRFRRNAEITELVIQRLAGSQAKDELYPCE